MNSFSYQQTVQEDQYDYPYHYIPEFSNGFFSQTKHWSWGYRYFGGMEVVFDQIKSNQSEFHSLIDVGCGDGRFIREFSQRFPDINCTGVDYSKKAIRFAKMMNPKMDFQCLDITQRNDLGTYDVATSIEVLEHIPPETLDGFVKSIHSLLNGSGMLILTVPHLNKVVNTKHYQHFTGSTLTKVLEPYFCEFRIIPFDKKTAILKLFQNIMGGLGRNFIITNKRLLNYFYTLYIDRYLYAPDERKCLRMAVVCKKRASVCRNRS